MYNVRVKHFQNGETQTKIYSHGVNTGYNRSVPENPYKHENPFDSNLCKQVYSFKDEMEKHEKSIVNSMNRSKQKIYDIARANNWKYFITLTFNPDIVDRYNYSSCSKKLSKWLNNTKQRLSPDFKYLIVPELHKDGAFHFHGLIANCDGLKIEESGHYDKKGNPIYNINSYGLGFTTATKVQVNQAATKYITKYTTKELIENTKNKKRYWTSRNIDLPIIEDFWMSDLEKDMFHNELLEDIQSFKSLDYSIDIHYRQVCFYENKGLTVNFLEDYF